MVDGEFLVDYLLQVLAYVAEPEVQALQGLQLRCYARGEGADGYVADVTEEVLDAYFFGFFGFDYGGGVHECFCGGGAVLLFESAVLAGMREGERGRQGETYVFDLFNGKVCVCWYADFFWLHVYNDEQWVGCVAFEQLVDFEIRRS